MIINKWVAMNRAQTLDFCKTCPSDGMGDDYPRLSGDSMEREIQVNVALLLVVEYPRLNSIVGFEDK